MKDFYQRPAAFQVIPDEWPLRERGRVPDIYRR